MAERSRVTRPPVDEPAPTGRLVFGRDYPCPTCKGKGTKFDQKKNEEYPCYGCNGTGIRRKEE